MPPPLDARTATGASRLEPIRVMVVDDSAVIRGMISRWIEAEPDLTVAASIRTGLDAVNQIVRVNPDVVVLDIEMPDMDGISALPLLLAKKPNLIIIMASTLTYMKSLTLLPRDETADAREWARFTDEVRGGSGPFSTGHLDPAGRWVWFVNRAMQRTTPPPRLRSL